NKIKVNISQLHFGEEPILSRTKGSGTIFFSHCNLRCVFCQNFLISHRGEGSEISITELAEMMLDLQNRGAHNINLVSPSHFSVQIIQALQEAKKKGLSVPIIWNSNAYENTEIIKQLDGLVDIYLPDLKYWDNQHAEKYSGILNYREHSCAAIREMFWQVGNIRAEEGLAKRGMMIRILNLPHNINNVEKSLSWIKENFGTDIWISLMFQYYPAFKANKYPEINKGITKEEYDYAVSIFYILGFHNGYIQEISCSDEYTPDFIKY
ncbi:MAG: hypothetical protein A2309_04485, partial [Bacteroidetes bacterium RIFOXYB2_FULL_35_7]